MLRKEGKQKTTTIPGRKRGKACRKGAKLQVFSKKENFRQKMEEVRKVIPHHNCEGLQKQAEGGVNRIEQRL